MKVFAFILSFYVLYLNAVPCIDIIRDNSMHKSEIMQTSDNHNHQSDADSCSPFCTCQCCQLNFVVSISASLSPVDDFKINYFEQSSNFEDTELFDFLIPPKS
jgi:hypothetical protein